MGSQDSIIAVVSCRRCYGDRAALLCRDGEVWVQDKLLLNVLNPARSGLSVGPRRSCYTFFFDDISIYRTHVIIRAYA